MSSDGEIVLSYENASLRESDIALLDPPNWLNDNVITFYYEYLENCIYKDYQDLVSFVCPQVVQCIKFSDAEDIAMMINTLQLHRKQYVFLPINDSVSKTSPGGSHWSVLLYKATSRSFEHYDSLSSGINSVHAQNIACILAAFLIGEEDTNVVFYEMECPRQVNGYDCGMHVMCNTDALCHIFLKNERRQLAEIASTTAISKARSRLKNLIAALIRKHAS